MNKRITNRIIQDSSINAQTTLNIISGLTSYKFNIIPKKAMIIPPIPQFTVNIVNTHLFEIGSDSESSVDVF